MCNGCGSFFPLCNHAICTLTSCDLQCSQHGIARQTALSRLTLTHVRCRSFLCLQAKHKTELDERTINVFISAREAGKFAAAGADAGGSSGSRKGGRGAWALQVFNLAWETTEADLVEHFKDCPVSH